MNPKIDRKNRLGEVEAKALIQFAVGFRTSPFCFTSNKDLKTEATTTHNVVLKTVSVSNPAEIGRVVKTQELP